MCRRTVYTAWPFLTVFTVAARYVALKLLNGKLAVVDESTAKPPAGGMSGSLETQVPSFRTDVEASQFLHNINFKCESQVQEEFAAVAYIYVLIGRVNWLFFFGLNCCTKLENLNFTS